MSIIKAGTKIVIKCETGQCGSESTDFYVLNSDFTEDELNKYCWELAVDYASSYGIYPEEDMPDDYDEKEEDMGGDTYSYNIEGYYEIYDADKHDGYRIGNETTFQSI